MPQLRAEVAQVNHDDIKVEIRKQLVEEVTAELQQSDRAILAVVRVELRMETEKQIREENTELVRVAREL